MTPNRRRTLLALRRTVRVFSYFKIEPTDDDRVRERQTCQACGYVAIVDLPVGTSRTMAERMLPYRNQGRGVQGRCPGCEKKERDRRFPLAEQD
jgi:hypothetical protein